MADDYNSSIRSYIKGELNEVVFAKMKDLFEISPELFAALKYILVDSSNARDDSTPERISIS